MFVNSEITFYVLMCLGLQTFYSRQEPQTEKCREGLTDPTNICMLLLALSLAKIWPSFMSSLCMISFGGRNVLKKKLLWTTVYDVESYMSYVFGINAVSFRLKFNFIKKCCKNIISFLHIPNVSVGQFPRSQVDFVSMTKYITKCAIKMWPNLIEHWTLDWIFCVH
jgi:hypothetical protein